MEMSVFGGTPAELGGAGGARRVYVLSDLAAKLTLL